MVLGPSGHVAFCNREQRGISVASVTPGPLAIVNGLAQLKVTVNPIEMTPSPVTYLQGHSRRQQSKQLDRLDDSRRR
jgi:hypothetical protein